MEKKRDPCPRAKKRKSGDDHASSGILRRKSFEKEIANTLRKKAACQEKKILTAAGEVKVFPFLGKRKFARRKTRKKIEKGVDLRGEEKVDFNGKGIFRKIYISVKAESSRSTF